MENNNHKDLLDQRGQALKELDTLSETVKNEKRSMTTDENEKFEKLADTVQRINGTIANLKRKAELDAQVIEAQEERGVTNEQKDLKEKRAEAFRNLLVSGEDKLTPEQREVLKARPNEKRAPQTVTTTGGGYLIPEGFSYELDIAMKQYLSVVNVARIFNTDSGNTIPYPKTNDTGNKGRLLGINTQITDTAIAFGTTDLLSFNFVSDSVLVPIQLMQDSGIPIESVVAELLGERLGRIMNEYFTTGTGTGQPQGIVTAADATGVTNAASTAISFDDLLNLMYAVDPAYSGKSQFMMNYSTEKAIMKLSIGTNYDQPLWTPSYRDGAPNLILGKPYTINQDMASIGAGNVSVLFGDMSKYIVRMVNGGELKRMDERYADYYQVGFITNKRADGRYVGSTGAQAAIKKLTHAT